MYDVEESLSTYKEQVKSELKSSRQRRRKMEELMDLAQSAHKTGRYEVSFDKFVYILAILESDPSAKTPDEMHAMIVSNIGSALHFLGETSIAATYYEKALEEFGQMRNGWVSWAMQGQLPEARKAYIQARLAQVAAGESPDASLYLDGYGKTRQFTQEEMDGTDKSWSIFQPRTWWYGGYKPDGWQPPSRDGAAASTAI